MDDPASENHAGLQNEIAPCPPKPHRQAQSVLSTCPPLPASEQVLLQGPPKTQLRERILFYFLPPPTYPQTLGFERVLPLL